MPASKAAASDPVAERAANETLQGGGNGIDAVVAAFLAAAGANEAVLLSPMAALIGGVGVGTHCVDGRCVQPGQGSPRPRGWVDDAPLPAAAHAAAHAAAPRSLAALAVLHAHGADRPLGELARPAATIAKGAGAKRRAELLLAYGGRGARLLGSDRVIRALLNAAGRTAGGLLTETDLSEAMPGDDQGRFVAVDEDLAVATPPWQDGPAPEPAEGRQAEVVVAADARGMVAALAYCPDPRGVLVTELELRLAGDGSPVRRGIPRVTPATPCPAPLPIALLRRSAPRWFAALGLGGACVIRADDLAHGSDQLATQLERLKDATAGSTALAASVLRRQTTVTRV